MDDFVDVSETLEALPDEFAGETPPLKMSGGESPGSIIPDVGGVLVPEEDPDAEPE